MPAFDLLILIFVILLWLAAGRWFRPIGSLICRIFGGAAASMKEEAAEQEAEAGAEKETETGTGEDDSP